MTIPLESIANSSYWYCEGTVSVYLLSMTGGRRNISGIAFPA
ncbi:MAG: hypothetical protein WAK10_08470 [Methanoregula sp.]